MLRLLATTAALLVAGPVLAADPSPPPSKMTYAIFREGNRIGQHIVTFEDKGPIKLITSESQVEVRTLGVPAYRYSHRGREEWKGDQLLSLRTTTEDNGQRFVVVAERRGEALADQGYRGPDVQRETLPGGLLPSSGWNVAQVHQNALLNSQYGTLARVQVVKTGPETVQTGSASVPTTRYRYTGDLRMDQWFAEDGRWIKGTFTAFDGSTIEYILQE